MAHSSPDSPSQEEARELHRRLLAGDPTAFADLAQAFLDLLVAWLSQTNRTIDPAICLEAAEDALLSLWGNSSSYSPERQTLEVYLRMSAQGDLKNILRKEQKHHEGRVSLRRVELSPEAGKYLGREDDPGLKLLIAELEQEMAGAIPDAVRQGLSEVELRILELMQRKERRTDVYAEVLGLMDKPPRERRQAVKRIKDRLKKRLERAGGNS